MSMTMKNHLFKSQQWPAEQAQIIQRIRQGEQVKFTEHFAASLQQRGVSVGEVYSIFKNGSAEIIQGHDRKTYAIQNGPLNQDEIRVFYGRTKANRIIHVVMALPQDGSLKFITAYFPTRVYFEVDFKTLKREWQFHHICESQNSLAIPLKERLQ